MGVGGKRGRDGETGFTIQYACKCTTRIDDLRERERGKEGRWECEKLVEVGKRVLDGDGVMVRQVLRSHVCAHEQRGSRTCV